MIARMRYASITVTDIGAALEFYVATLGFKVLVQMPLPGDNQFVMVAPPEGGSTLVFSLPLPNREHAASTSIAFETDGVQGTYEKLVPQGVEFVRTPGSNAVGRR